MRLLNPTAALIMFICVANPCFAGLGDYLQGLKGACGQVANKATFGALQRLTEEAKPVLDRLPERAMSMTDQLKGLSCTSVSCSAAYSTTLAIEAIKVPWRVYRFESNLGGIKDHMIVPLVANLRVIRENYESNPEEVAKALARLTIYTAETELKYSKMLAEQLTISYASLATGMVIPKIGAASAPQEVMGIFAKSVFSHVWYALFSNELKWDERLVQLIRVEKVLSSFLKDTSSAVGWNLIEEEVLEWQKSFKGENKEAEIPEEEV